MSNVSFQSKIDLIKSTIEELDSSNHDLSKSTHNIVQNKLKRKTEPTNFYEVFKI